MQVQVEEMEEATALALKKLEEYKLQRGKKNKSLDVDPKIKGKLNFLNNIEIDDELLAKHKEMII